MKKSAKPQAASVMGRRDPAVGSCTGLWSKDNGADGPDNPQKGDFG